MDRIARVTAVAAVLAAVGCTSVVSKPKTAARELVERAAAKARGQAPDGGPKAPTGPLLPPALPPSVEAAPPTQASYAPPPTAAAVAVTDALRDRQLRIAATIGADTVITDDEVWMAVRQRSRDKDVADLFGEAKEAKERQIYKEELRRLIERELLIHDMGQKLKKAPGGGAEQTEKMNAFAREQSGKYMDALRKQNKIPSEAEFVKALTAQGVTYKSFRRQHERDTLKNMYLQELLKDKDKYVTLNDLWDYYTAHPAEFAVEEKVKWLDLFVAFDQFKTPAEAHQYADAVWKRATAGADFVALVEKYGHGDSKLRHGEGVGTKTGEIQPRELEPSVLELSAGQVSPLLKTSTGYHVVKVTERERAGTRAFDQAVQAGVRAKLANKLQEQEYHRIIDELWRKYRPKAVEQ